MRRFMRGNPVLLLGGLAVALAVVLLAPLASGSPDGLERVALDEGFADRAEEAPYDLAADYAAPGIEDDGLATVVAGAGGVLLVSAVTLGGGALLRRRRLARERTGAPLHRAPADH